MSRHIVIAEEPPDTPPSPPPSPPPPSKTDKYTTQTSYATSEEDSHSSKSRRNSSRGISLKRLHSNNDPNDIDSTVHHVRGSGILASSKDLVLDENVFAQGCKLLLAAARGDLTMVQRLLQNNPSHVNFRDYDRRTALHVASSEGHLELVEFLIQNGAHVNRSDRWGGSPLDDAHRHRHQEVIQYLRSVGGTTGSADQTTNLITAAAEGDVDEVLNLIQNGSVNLNEGDYDQRTALHLAAGEGHSLIVELLLKHGADPNVCDRWGGTPLDDASRKKSKHCTDILQMYHAKPGNITTSKVLDASTKSIDHDPNMTIDVQELEIVEKIGSGAFGEIYKSRWRGTLVAAKFLKSAKIKKWAALAVNQNEEDLEEDEMGNSERETALNDFRIETAILRKLRHPNICMLLAYSTTQDYEVMVSELMKCSLLDIFKANALHGNLLSKRKQLIYAQQLAQGMNYLHNCKPPIIHRDLKPANLLIDYSGTLKISDFGLAKVRPNPEINEEDQFTMTGETGSYRFMAPEVFRHEQYTETVDVYSYAMIYFCLLKGEPPWPTLSGVKAVTAAAMEGRRPYIPRDWDSRLSNLLQSCWDENPRARPSFGTVLVKLNDYSRDVYGMNSDSIMVSSGDGRKCCVVM